MKKLILKLTTVGAMLLSLAPASSQACSRIVFPYDNGSKILVGRTMDWFEPTESKIWMLPRGVERNGLVDNPISWTSKYGSVVTSMYDSATADGLNEQGLAVSLLYLTETDFGARDAKIKGLSVSLWAQYMLDNFSTVKEALESIKANPFQVVGGMIGQNPPKPATVHLAMTDATGDTAVIEYTNGKMNVYHGKEYVVMTNSPPYAEQLTNLRKYKGFGGEEPLPGTTSAADRFVRAAFYLKSLPETNNTKQAIAEILSVIRNVSQPFGTEDPERPNISPTRWRIVAELSNPMYLYESSFSPNLIWVNLKSIDFSDKSLPKSLDVSNESHDFIGDVTNQFVSTPMFKFLISR